MSLTSSDVYKTNYVKCAQALKEQVIKKYNFTGLCFQLSILSLVFGSFKSLSLNKEVVEKFSLI